MVFVVDASMTMTWCFITEATAETRAMLRRVRAEGAVVPAIWPLEVANALIVGERRQRLTQAETAAFGQLLVALPIRIEELPVARALGAVLALGRQQGLSAYDAAYLELAAREGLPLATRDARLRDAAARIGVPLLA
ncbi:MAG TPA: type II toxin-antitoxin system VapC family toxin [Thermomicrobiales bacterium]|nr:type II toxin-antitoxin system VapC family toxin [Thermomicrobiales bacterium]